MSFDLSNLSSALSAVGLLSTRMNNLRREAPRWIASCRRLIRRPGEVLMEIQIQERCRSFAVSQGYQMVLDR